MSSFNTRLPSLVAVVVGACLSTPALGSSTRADLALASPFADHMVLQRDRPIPLWGSAPANTTVTIKLATRSATAAADENGRWQTLLEALPSGGPFSIEVTASSEHLSISDVLLGDLFLCTGQSNMQFSLGEAIGGEAAAARAASRPKVRLAKVGNAWTDSPQSSAKIAWQPATPASARSFSAVGYFFADELSRDPALANVPLGLIQSSVGGTMIEAWMPREALAPFAPRDLYDSMFGIKPTTLYNGMIAPLGPIELKAVLWYQGEGNSGHPENYAAKLAALFQSWRTQFNSPDLPFIVIGLPDYLPAWGGQYWQWLREAQAAAVARTPQTSLALAINTTDGRDLHPKEKRDIARRAALLARHDFYHESIEARGPVFKSATPVGGQIRVTFATRSPLAIEPLPTDAGATETSELLAGFAIAGEDGAFRYATARIDGKDVLLSTPLVPAPKYARYAWSGVPRGTLANASHLPAYPFRTDTLPPENIAIEPAAPYPPTRHLIGPNYDLTITPQGHLTSLILKGKQFLSNDPGNDGGAIFPTFFGPRNLANIAEQGPATLIVGDDTLSLLLSATPTTLTLTFTNKAKDNADFRLSLNALVTTKTNADKSVNISRKNVAATVTGIDTVERSDDGPRLKTTVSGHSTKTIAITLGPWHGVAGG